MRETTTRALGVAAVLGALLAVLASIPGRWYGVPQTGAYVFDPATFTPLWLSRTVVPAVTVVAGGLLLAGFLGVVLRDRPTAGSGRRLASYAAVVALAVLELTAVVLAATGGLSGSAASLTDALVVVVAVLVAVGAAVLLLAAFVVTGLLYVRVDHLRLGVPLVAGPAVAVAAVAVLSVVSVGDSTLLTVLPMAAAFVAVGVDLWTRTEAVPGAGSRSGA